jgi:hypothetical protein
LLRETHITIYTYHKNLTFPLLNSESSAKVKRLKLFIQQSYFDIQYIPREENIVADAFSRLLPDNPETVSASFEFKIPRDKYTLISQIYKSTVGHFGVEKQFIKQCPILPEDDSTQKQPENMTIPSKTGRSRINIMARYGSKDTEPQHDYLKAKKLVFSNPRKFKESQIALS